MQNGAITAMHVIQADRAPDHIYFRHKKHPETRLAAAVIHRALLDFIKEVEKLKSSHNQFSREQATIKRWFLSDDVTPASFLWWLQILTGPNSSEYKYLLGKIRRRVRCENNRLFTLFFI